MKKFRILFFMLAFMILFSAMCTASTWQKSDKISIKIGVRDKYASPTTEYIANFVVYAPNNKTYYYSIKGIGDKFTSSVFPNDYNELHPAVGDYFWQCYVDGETVISGQFRITINSDKSSLETYST